MYIQCTLRSSTCSWGRTSSITNIYNHISATIINYFNSGVTAGTSGTSGIDGTNGTSGTSGIGSSGTSGFGSAGTSGFSGTSGITGTNGSSGITGTAGSSGSSASSGTSGSSGTNGTSGSSGVDGTFYGSSGTSGFSGYGAATRVWIFTGDTTLSSGYFYGTGSGGFDLGLLTEIWINKNDINGINLLNWLTSWQSGVIKIENIDDLSNSAVYHIDVIPQIAGNTVIISGLTSYTSDGYFLDFSE